MKTATCVLASALCLAGCNKQPSVSLTNASTNEAAAVKQSGVMSTGTMIEPGEWESRATVEEMNIPGLPPAIAEKIKQNMAAHQNQASKHCVTQADVKKPKEDFFGGDKSCRYDHFNMGGGKIDVAMTCNEEGRTQSTKVAGSYTSTSYSIDASSTGSGGGEGGMNMKMHVDAQRVGECTAKDD